MDVRKFKGRVYEVVSSCDHAKIKIDRATRTIRCMVCFESLDPFDTAMNYVDALDEYTDKLNAYRQRLVRETARSKLLARKLESRKRTKCNHCAKMTNINLKEPTLLEVRTEAEGDWVRGDAATSSK